MNSYIHLCGLLEDFYKYSGLRINNDKTEIFAIDSFKLGQRDFIHRYEHQLKYCYQIVKTLIIPKFLSNAALISISNDLINEINKLIYGSNWKVNDKIKRSAVINDVIYSIKSRKHC